MTVRELIAKLQEMPQDLPVALADWNEGYREPSELAVSVSLRNGIYYKDNRTEPVRTDGEFVIIGDDS